VRLSVIGLAMVAVAGIGIVGLSKITPTGFLPEDDQGALFVVVQMPGGASVGRTTEAIHQAEDILREEEAVADVTSVVGLNFIDNYSQPNAGFMVVTLKPFDERKARSLGAPELIARLGAKLRQIQGGTIVPLAPPPLQIPECQLSSYEYGLFLVGRLRDPPGGALLAKMRSRRASWQQFR
jgi:multidrug efflux pump subunit AcrB